MKSRLGNFTVAPWRKASSGEKLNFNRSFAHVGNQAGNLILGFGMGSNVTQKANKSKLKIGEFIGGFNIPLSSGLPQPINGLLAVCSATLAIQEMLA